MESVAWNPLLVPSHPLQHPILNVQIRLHGRMVIIDILELSPVQISAMLPVLIHLRFQWHAERSF